jgi:hypothetical protein
VNRRGISWLCGNAGLQNRNAAVSAATMGGI